MEDPKKRPRGMYQDVSVSGRQEMRLTMTPLIRMKINEAEVRSKMLFPRKKRRIKKEE